MLSCTASYFLLLPYLHIKLSFPVLCCPVLLYTALYCLIHISHCQFKNMLPHAVLHCFLLPYPASSTLNPVPPRIMLPFTASYWPMLLYPHITLTLQKHAVSCCHPLLFTFFGCLTYISHCPFHKHTALSYFILPLAALSIYHTANPKRCCLMLSCTTSYFLMLPYLHIMLSFPQTCCFILSYASSSIYHTANPISRCLVLLLTT